MTTTTFETAKAGDRVWALTKGWGEIIRIDGSSDYPLYVKYDSTGFDTFTFGGYLFCNFVMQGLFWDAVVIEAPAKPMPALKVDTKVLVWDDRFEVRYKRYFSNFDYGKIYVFRRGATSWNSEGTMMFDNWELAE